MQHSTDFRWPSDPTVRLTRFDCPADEKSPAIVILPGGGYAAIAPKEAAPVAEHFAQRGWRSFVLSYSTRWPDFDRPHQGEANRHTLFPEPLRELAAAVAYLRQNADALGVDGRVILMGFSAGAHLAANYMNFWNTPEVFDGIAEPALLKPDACSLGYPAVELDSVGMMAPAIFGEGVTPDEAALRRWIARYHVGEQTPPCFLFHSVTDPMVPVQQSIDLAQALDAAGIAYELHLFGCGGHAYGLGRNERAGTWPELCDSFLRHILAQPEAYDRRIVRSRSPF